MKLTFSYSRIAVRDQSKALIKFQLAEMKKLIRQARFINVPSLYINFVNDEFNPKPFPEVEIYFFEPSRSDARWIAENFVSQLMKIGYLSNDSNLWTKRMNDKGPYEEAFLNHSSQPY